MTSAGRWGRNLAYLGLGLVLALGIGSYGLYAGWNVEAVEPAAISATLRPHDVIERPPGDGPFPAAVLVHGCAGLRGHNREWAAFLRDRGFLVVAVDSYAGRGLGWEEVCAGRALLGHERAGDVLVSLDDVRRMPDVDPERIAVVGWSHGAWAVMDLLALDPPSALPTNLASVPADPFAGLQRVVLFYPYCGLGARSPGAWSLHVPTLFLLSGADRVVDTGECVGVAGDLADRGRPVELHVYEGQPHGFDATDPPDGLPSFYDATTAADARARVDAFLAPLLDPSG